MNMTSVAQQAKTASFLPPAKGKLQRKCACGNKTMEGGECGACRQKRLNLQRQAVNQGKVNDALSIVHDVVRSSGQPLDSQTRAYMEPRFGHDFSQVRIHNDADAANTASSVNAVAYTVGKNIAFGPAQYAPGTTTGKHLLAHELAHVVQQGGSSMKLNPKSANDAEGSMQTPSQNGSLTIGRPNDSYEQEADAAADAVMRMSHPDFTTNIPASGVLRRSIMPLLQRRLVVNPGDSVPLPAGVQGPPTPLTFAVQGLLADTCPDGKFQVDSTSGNVTTPLTRFCEQSPPAPYLTADISSTPAGCTCLCDVVNDAQTTTIAFRAGGGPGTAPGSMPGAGPVPGQGGQATDPTVSVDPRFRGQYLINGKWVDIPFYLIFAHEVCGHALPKMKGTHVARGPTPAGGTPPQEQHAVDVERNIAAEHNPPLPRRPDDYSGGARPRP